MIWEAIRDLFGDDAPKPLFKPEWKNILGANVPVYSKLPEDLKERLHERIANFVAHTRFEGCNGLKLTEEMILTVAGQACLLVIHRDGKPYPKLTTVYLYPSTFSSVIKRQDSVGIVTEGKVQRLGESWETGTVILSWYSVAQGARNPNDARNVTLHEFAHQLDHENGDTDGAPPLTDRAAYRSWSKVFSANYLDLQERVDAGKRTLLDPYGATEPAEFFAVATETFFEKPKQLSSRRPDLYSELRNYYGVDPMEWG